MLNRIASLLNEPGSGFLLRFVPEAARDSAAAVTRAENLVSAMLLSGLVMPAYGLLYHALDDDVNAGLCFGGMLGIGLALLLLRTSGKTVLARELCIGAVYLTLLALTFRLGGATAPTLVWFAACPLIATASGGPRAGCIWSVLVLLTAVGVYLADLAGMRTPVAVSDMRLLATVSTIGFVLTVAVFLLLFERNSISIVTRLDQALDLIRDLAIKDELTGIFNRRELLRVAEQERIHVARQGGAFCVCLIDVDYFKKINDQFGHALGDLALKRIATAIQKQVRRTDCFGRYGGEEFLLLFRGAELRASRLFVERIRECIEKLDFPEIGPDRHLTISAGVAQHRPHETVGQAIARADDALYLAKRGGRNRVVMADENPAGDSAADEIQE